MYTYVETHQIVQFKHMQVFVSQLYLNRAAWEKKWVSFNKHLLYGKNIIKIIFNLHSK